MTKIQLRWAALALLCLIFAAISEYRGSEEGLISKQVRVLVEGSETPQAVTTVTHSPAERIWHVIAEACWALGSSIIISVFIIGRLEEKRRADQESYLENIRGAINQDVFSSLFNRLVPNELFEVVKSEVINCKAIRRDAQWLFDFREISDGKEVELRQTIKHRLHNTGKTPVADAVQIIWDKEHAGKNGLVRVRCVASDGKEVDFDHAKPEMTGGVTIDKRKGDKETLVSVPISIPPLGHADVTMVIKQVYSADNIYDTYFTRFPIINATLTASFPDGYEFELFQSLSSGLSATLSESTRSIYEARGGMLPGQGFVYSLKKLRQST